MSRSSWSVTSIATLAFVVWLVSMPLDAAFTLRGVRQLAAHGHRIAALKESLFGAVTLGFAPGLLALLCVRRALDTATQARALGWSVVAGVAYAALSGAIGGAMILHEGAAGASVFAWLATTALVVSAPPIAIACAALVLPIRSPATTLDRESNALTLAGVGLVAQFVLVKWHAGGMSFDAHAPASFDLWSWPPLVIGTAMMVRGVARDARLVRWVAAVRNGSVPEHTLIERADAGGEDRAPSVFRGTNPFDHDSVIVTTRDGTERVVGSLGTSRARGEGVWRRRIVGAALIGASILCIVLIAFVDVFALMPDPFH